MLLLSLRSTLLLPFSGSLLAGTTNALTMSTERNYDDPSRNVSELRNQQKLSKDSLQMKTMQRWWDSYLRPRGVPVHHLSEQMQDGVLGFRLVEALEGSNAAPVVRNKINILGRYRIHAAPRMRVQRLENLGMFLNMLRNDKGMKLVNIGAEDLLHGNKTLVLGVSWELIKYYDLGGRAAETGADGGGDARVGGELMDWVAQHVGAYPDVDLTSHSGWTKCFRDGKALCALLHAKLPGSIDYDDTKAWLPEKRLRTLARASQLRTGY